MEIELQDLQKIEIFATIFQQIKVFTEHVQVSFTENGIYLQTMDTSRVSIFEMNIPSQWFDVYNIDKPYVIGLHSPIFFKILNARDKNQKMALSYDSSNDTLSLSFTAKDNKTSFDKFFEIPLVDIDSEQLNIPTIEYQAEFSMPSSIFSNLISQLKQFGETVEIECNEEQITLVSHSQDNGKMSVNIGIDDLDEYAIEEGQTLNMTFSLNYLYNIAQFQKIAKNIKLFISMDYPLQLKYEFGEGANVVCYLAPRMNDEE